MVAQRLPRPHLTRLHPIDAVVQGDPGAGDSPVCGFRRRPDHVAVDRDLPARRARADRAPRADCARSAVGISMVRPLACRPTPRGACAPEVARGSMPYSAVTPAARLPFQPGRPADPRASPSPAHACRRTLRSRDPSAYFHDAALERDRAQLVGLSAARSHAGLLHTCKLLGGERRDGQRGRARSGREIRR